VCFCSEVCDMDTLQMLQKELEKYQRLEVERQHLLKQKLMLELELAQVLASQHPVT